MIRLHFSPTLGRWIVVATLICGLAGASALSVAAQTSGDGSAVATTADPAADDAVMTDADQAQATNAAPAVAPVPTPTVAPYQFGPTGC